MEFDFSSHDYEAFAEAKEGFVEDLAEWYRERTDHPLAAHHVDLFLGWNFEHREQPLRTLGPDDFEDYLLDFLPRSYLGGPEDVPEIRRSLEAMIEFLALIEQLDQPFARAAAIIAFMAEIEPEVAEAMADDTKAGTGKSLLGAQLTGDDGSPLPDLEELLDAGDLDLEELQELLDERVRAFNELPFEERERLTDTGPLRRDPIPLGITVVPPSPAEVEAVAASSDVLRMVDGFVQAAMERGIALTDSDNIKPAEARRLVDELDTGDDVGDMRSSTELRWVTLVDDLATAVGAVDRMRTVIRADGSWFDLPPVERTTRLCDTILGSGFLSSRPVSVDWLSELRQLVDDGIPHWFGPGLNEGSSVDADGLMEAAVEVAASSPYGPTSLRTGGHLDEMVVDMMAELLQGLERFGLLSWRGAERAPDGLGSELHRREPIGRASVPMGGTLELTALGRAVLPPHVEAAGYSFDTVADIGDATPVQLVEIAMGTGLRGAELLERWRVDLPVGERLVALADRVRVGNSLDRLVIFDVFDEVVDRSVVEPVVRQLLDSTAAGRAAHFLLERGWASPEEVGGFVDLTPLVDMLFLMSDEPEDFDTLFQQAVAGIDDDVLDELWRHDQPETLVVLEAAGRYVSDRALAKRARTAAHKHRSWLGNLDR